MVRRAIAQRREIRNQADVPEEHRDREVGRDREHVPEQRAAEVRPDAVVVRQRRQEPRHPDAADVNARENRRAHHREERHRFRRAVDRRAPLLPEQEQDRRDQRSGVTDTDPEHEVGDVPRPADRMIQSPDADAGRNLIAEAEETERRDQRRDGRTRPTTSAAPGLRPRPQIRSVIQLKFRLFRTSGTRASGCSTEAEASPAITSGAVVAPSIQ